MRPAVGNGMSQLLGPTEQVARQDSGCRAAEHCPCLTLRTYNLQGPGPVAGYSVDPADWQVPVSLPVALTVQHTHPTSQLWLSVPPTRRTGMFL